MKHNPFVPREWRTAILTLDNGERVRAEVLLPGTDKPVWHADALIYSLWVDEAHRGHEVAKHLMEAVERELKRCGIATVAISWDGRDSPQWVLHWYKKLGFEEKAFGYQCCTLLKRL